jgi:hypothetical protein
MHALITPHPQKVEMIHSYSTAKTLSVVCCATYKIIKVATWQTIFTIFKLRSTTAQMPALAFFRVQDEQRLARQNRVPRLRLARLLPGANLIN